MTVYTRQMIGLTGPKPNCLRRRTGDLEGITWHWTGTGGMLHDPDPLKRLRGIQEYHMGTLGYCDIAYNGAFDDKGNVYFLRDSAFVGAHAQSTDNWANEHTVGWVFLEDSDGFTKEAVGAMNAINWLYSQQPGHPKAQWWTHHYWGEHGGRSTDCCGEQLRAFVKFCGGKD